MRLLLLMLLIMPYENSPYLYLGANLLGEGMRDLLDPRLRM